MNSDKVSPKTITFKHFGRVYGCIMCIGEKFAELNWFRNVFNQFNSVINHSSNTEAKKKYMQN